MIISSFKIDFKRSHNLLLIILNLFKGSRVVIIDNLTTLNIKASRLTIIIRNL